MLAQAEKLFSSNKENLELRLGELEHLPVGNSEADLAVISMVMHHLTNPEKSSHGSIKDLKSRGHIYYC